MPFIIAPFLQGRRSDCLFRPFGVAPFDCAQGRQDRPLGGREIGFVWVCFVGTRNRGFFHKPCLQRGLHCFLSFRSLALFFRSPNGRYIFITLCYNRCYVHFGLFEFGFVWVCLALFFPTFTKCPFYIILC